MQVVMHRFIQASLISVALLCATAARADEPAYASRAESTPDDIKAITQLTTDFRVAVKEKNVKELSAMMMSSDILFSSPMPAEGIKMVNERYDVNFDGVASGGFTQFAQFLGSTPKPVEEKFYNIKITQDANVGWVTFDYEFLVDDNVQNYGIETWQVMKDVDNNWRILSVVWSSHFKK